MLLADPELNFNPSLAALNSFILCMLNIWHINVTYFPDTTLTCYKTIAIITTCKEQKGMRL